MSYPKYTITKVEIVNDVASEPLSLTEAKRWLRVDFATDDDLIQNLIKSARVWLEQYTGITLTTKKYNTYLRLNAYNVDIDLPYGPVTAINSIYDRVDYNVVTTDFYEFYAGRLRIDFVGDFKITYTAGLGSCPDPLIEDMKRIVAWGYQNRGLNFASDTGSSIVGFPEPQTLNATGYKTVVI